MDTTSAISSSVHASQENIEAHSLKERWTGIVERIDCQMSLSKKLTCLCGRCFIFLRLLPPMTILTPLTHCIRVYKYTYSRRERGGGGGELTREKVRGAG
jgi:hypothetical protein